MTETRQEIVEIRPQDGFQMKFLSCPADIVFGGGKAGSGKTFSLLLEPLRHLTTIRGFGGVIFRRETPQITNEGGLWDTSMELYPYVGGIPKSHDLSREFPFKNRLKFTHLEQEKDIFKRQGTNVPFIGFDELTHFTRKQFFYLLSRNRSTCGVSPYVRGTCNPDPDSRVKEFISWRIDPDTGFIIKERDGIIRFFTIDGNNVVRGDTKQEVANKCPHIFTKEVLEKSSIDDLIKSFTFIEGDIYDNKALLSKDPGYLGNLFAQDEVEKQKLLEGNRNVTADDLSIYDYACTEDLFSNFVEESDDGFITNDVARFGRDLAVVFVWNGWLCHTISIWTKSSLTTLVNDIEKRRKIFKIPISHCMIDQDGVGGGVVDMGGYKGFSGGNPSMIDPKTKIKENYADLKTQCYYRSAEKVNTGKASISLDNIYVDGVKSNTITLGKTTYNIKDLIQKHLRSIKRKNPDKEGKRMINSKSEQKILLGGLSPDFADTFMMREVFDLLQISGDIKIRTL